MPAAQLTPPASEYIARSTTIWMGAPPTLSTIIPNRLPRVSGKNSSAAGAMLKRALALTSYSRAIGRAAVLEQHGRADRPATDEVLATSTYVSVSRGPPTSPSATAQRVPVVVSPGLLCASCQVLDVGPGHHIDRSTMIGTPLVEVMRVDIAASASAASASSTQMLKRLLPATS